MSSVNNFVANLCDVTINNVCKIHTYIDNMCKKYTRQVECDLPISEQKIKMGVN